MAGLGKECCTPGPPASEGGAVGVEEKLSGYDVYINWPAGSTKAVILASDIFGWAKPLLRKLADTIAAAGFVSVVPDYFENDPLDSGKYGSAATGFNWGPWLAKHPMEGLVEESKSIIKELKGKGITSVGVAGFCYGAKCAVLLAKDSVIHGAVLCHPSLVNLDDIKAVKVPLAILAAENDKITPVDAVKGFEAYLQSQDVVEYVVKIFPGTNHGWTVKYEEKDEKAVSSATEAHTDLISFFKKHL